MRKPEPLPCMLLALALAACGSARAAKAPYGFGTAAVPADVAAWNIDIRPDGDDLPPGQGTVGEGARLYAEQCAACHGADARGTRPADRGAFPALAGGIGSLASAKPVKTVGSFWPYPTILFDYIRRAMPLPRPGSLSADQVYALSAFILWKNGLIGDGTTLSRRNLAALRMPNADGFYPGEDALPKPRKP